MIAGPDRQISKTDANGIVTYQLSKIDNKNPKTKSLSTGTYNITITGKDDLNGQTVIPITVDRADVIIAQISIWKTEEAQKIHNERDKS